MRRISRIFLILLVINGLAVFAPIPATRAQSDCSIIQLTNNSIADESPQIDNGQIVWLGYDGDDYDVFFYDGETITQLTDNSEEETEVRIYDGRVVWQGYDGDDEEIFLFDGRSVIQITDNDTDDYTPRIDERQIVWYGEAGDDSEIFSYHDGAIFNVSNNPASYDYDPDTDGGQIVWTGSDGQDNEIFFYDGWNVINLSNNDQEDLLPKIDEGQVVWETRESDDIEIFLYDGSNIIQLTDDEEYDLNPQIDGGQVVWATQNLRLYLYENGKTIELSNHEAGIYIADFEEPAISDEQVVWTGETEDGTEILFYNGSTVSHLGNDHLSGYSPQIDEGQIVWLTFMGEDENTSEIYMASCGQS
ncbi:MAG TPA: hypothetical protein VHP83_16030 [Aggregatilineaceae bacterium]|nr:hypothetical protein [Aggregatilineaceae bacterium]